MQARKPLLTRLVPGRHVIKNSTIVQSNSGTRSPIDISLFENNPTEARCNTETLTQGITK